MWLKQNIHAKQVSSPLELTLHVDILSMFSRKHFTKPWPRMSASPEDASETSAAKEVKCVNFNWLRKAIYRAVRKPASRPAADYGKTWKARNIKNGDFQRRKRGGKFPSNLMLEGARAMRETARSKLPAGDGVNDPVSRLQFLTCSLVKVIHRIRWQ